MSKKIAITIPSSQGEQTFYFGRKAVLLCTTALFSVPALIGGATYMHFESQQELASQAGDAQQLIETLIVEKEQTEFLYAEQVETNHSLSQTLTEKEGAIQLLGKRVFDVESVLGLADEELLTDDVSLEDRIDAAAIDSAVRATMFRLIPNDSPMTYQRISSSYGRRTNPISGKRHNHTGIDLTCKRGEEILAPADGVIETVRPSNKGFGNFLTMRHSFGFMSSYAHLQKFKVRSGQFVSKGDVIANCGNSGNSTGPHLHYEVRFLGRSLNPQYLMDWTPENFNYVFEKEKKVKWGPLVQLIDNVVRLQINLTNVPYISSTIDTVSSEDNKKPITTN
ncbi:MULTISPECIES: M23 family metallopeptidase [Vibrio]|uniref:Peptidase M23 n=2 Tax=Vibrio cyclitrophicus TaxID=47951 RepID=A0A7Z1MDR2_9VIBR|nr:MULTISPECIES: M23 family metallopeptidase [Vibrio]MBE8606595.1 M23 family metallopeptidase [Vibrio sp. OPT10]MBU2933780.1 M23 family metallopeptidase [Vibrio cyclitrophicus]MDH5881160.1 M23 family metallopeptidase [Vibrio sp. S/42/10]NOH43821.1 M23 family metallopeptidase [Vibrio cyclitrophicus]NOH93445.1 M23 family metallopeptidase [Vibrio sp. AIC-3]|tara:strand:+ start:174 stop:1184 length:1011 start_codon:yes stop_codon:yes gene_type:complete